MDEDEHCRLPEEVIVDLLSRLPVKSLLRFRCVSKQWLNLISSVVQHLHDHRNHRNHYSLFWNSDCESHQGYTYIYIKIYVVDMVAERVHHQFNLDFSGSLWQSAICCRDLVCFISSSRVYVCNPSTKEFVEVPGRGGKNGQFTLGYLPSTKQYKFACVLDRHSPSIECTDDCEMGCEIFTITDGGRVDSGSWRVTRNLPCVALLSDGVCVNGVINWLVSYPRRNNYDNIFMLSFDLDKEEYEVVSCPESCPSPRYDNVYLLELKGLLRLVHHVYNSDGPSILIKTLFLKDQKAHHWVEGHNINITIMHHDRIIVHHDIDRIRLQPYNPADDNDEGLVLLSSQEGVLYFNVRTQVIRRPEML